MSEVALLPKPLSRKIDGESHYYDFEKLKLDPSLIKVRLDFRVAAMKLLMWVATGLMGGFAADKGSPSHKCGHSQTSLADRRLQALGY